MNKRKAQTNGGRSQNLKLIIIEALDEIPDFASEADEVAFWDTHMLSDCLWAELGAIPDDFLPPVRAKGARPRS